MPQTRQNTNSEAPAAYTYAGAEKRNTPTSETAARMTPEQIAEHPIPEQEYETRVRAPSLVWNRQESADHARTYGPLYVHDKVSPAQFIQTLLQDNPQSDLFAEFNGFKKPDGTPADDAGWYPYEYRGHWTNRLIRATGQRAMASLLYKDNLRGQVNLIYMDPPYNISFRSNFQAAADNPETRETLDDIPKDPIAIRAFRDNYRNDVHSYLDGIHEQLLLGRELLAETGSFIMQIGPDNLHQVAILMSEVFGTDNHVATIPYTTGVNYSTRMLPEVGNWLVWFTKDKTKAKYYQLYATGSRADTIALMNQYYLRYETGDGEPERLTKEQIADPDRYLPENARVYDIRPLTSQHESSSGRSEPYIALDGKIFPCPSTLQWRVDGHGMRKIEQIHRMAFGSNGQLYWKRYEDEIPGRSLDAVWSDGGRVRNKQYIVETPAKVLERCVLMTTDPGDLVLDLTCGSGAMPATAETWGRRWIACDVSAVSIAIARERIATNIYPYHLLKDSLSGAQADHELAQELMPPDQRAPFAPPPGGETAYGHDPAQGFVNERQMRVSAATLAYGPNPDGSDIIHHPDRTKQDRRKRRVAAPFTVESDSPYRAIMPTAADEAAEAVDLEQQLQTGGFTLPPNGGHDAGQNGANAVTERIVSSLETSGIGQPISDQIRHRYRVENLQPAEMPDVTHTGTLITPDETRHRAHFYIGAEDEIISSLKTGYAAQTTAEIRGVDYLVMVGFGRDEDALPAARKYPRLNILQVEAHKDLQLPHLAESKHDHAFTIISEPEIRLDRLPDGKITLTVLGLNAFNPTAGIVEPPNTRHVMGLMTDTAYDGESFRVRLMNIKRVKRNQKTPKRPPQSPGPRPSKPGSTPPNGKPCRPPPPSPSTSPPPA